MPEWRGRDYSFFRKRDSAKFLVVSSESCKSCCKMAGEMLEFCVIFRRTIVSESIANWARVPYGVLGLLAIMRRTSSAGSFDIFTQIVWGRFAPAASKHLTLTSGSRVNLMNVGKASE